MASVQTFQELAGLLLTPQAVREMIPLPIRNTRSLYLELELSKLMPVSWAKTITELPDSFTHHVFEEEACLAAAPEKTSFAPDKADHHLLTCLLWVAVYESRVWFRIVIFSLQFRNGKGECFLGRPESPAARLQGQYCYDWEWPCLRRWEEGRGEQSTEGGGHRYSWARMVGVSRPWRSVVQHDPKMR